MIKAPIILRNEFENYIGEKYKKFRSIDRSNPCPFNHMTYEAPKNAIVCITIAASHNLKLEFFNSLAEHYRENNYIQTYVIFPFEFLYVSAVFDPYSLGLPPNTKMVYTSSLPEAVAYGLGILEKGASHGIYGLQN